MKREEFMSELEALLHTLSRDERQEALQYYWNYFADAGAEREEQVIRELVSPQKVAAIILADFSGEMGEYSETGYRDERFEEKDSPAIREDIRRKQQTEEHNTDQQNNKGAGKSHASVAFKIILVVAIIFIAARVARPLLLAIAAIIIALVCVVVGLLVGFVITSLAIMVSGMVLFVTGLMKLVVSLPIALLLGGVGLLLFGFGLVLTVGTVKLILVIVPVTFRFLVEFCRRPFHRKAVS